MGAPLPIRNTKQHLCVTDRKMFLWICVQTYGLGQETLQKEIV